MTTFSRPAWATSIIALLLLPPCVVAGPVGWDYSATFTTEADGARLYLGQYVRPSAAEPDGFLEGCIFAQQSVVNTTGSYRGSAHLRVGLLSEAGVGVDWNSEVPSSPMDQRVRAGLTIRDAASGTSADFSAFGSGDLVSDPMLNDIALTLTLDWGTDQEQVIGANLYRVRFSTESDDTGAWVVADVSSGPVVANPEPTTLALSGLGLALVGLRRARRNLGTRASFRVPYPAPVPLR